MNNFQSNVTPYDIMTKKPYNVKVKQILDEIIDGEILDSVVQKVIKRFPHLRKKLIKVDESLLFTDNDLPIKVYESEYDLDHCGKDVNYHLISVRYYNNVISFNLSHSLSGGCGLMPFIQATIYYYFKERTGKNYNVPYLFDINEKPRKEELVFPKKDTLPKFKLFLPRKTLHQCLTLEDENNPHYYVIQISQNYLMQYSRKNDGSPSSIISSFMFKALANLYKDNTLPIYSGIAHNCRDIVNCKNSLLDIVHPIITTYPVSTSNWTVEHLSTITRASVYLQTDESYCLHDVNKMLSRFDKLDGFNTLEEKIKYAEENPMLRAEFVSGNPLTFGLSYAGRQDWGDLNSRVLSTEIVADSPLLLEIMNTHDMFQISFNTNSKDDRYYEAFCRILNENRIPYMSSGLLKANIPKNDLSHLL